MLTTTPSPGTTQRLPSAAAADFSAPPPRRMHSPMCMDVATADSISRALNAQAERTARSVEAPARFVAALALAILAVASAAWLIGTCADSAASCAVASLGVAHTTARRAWAALQAFGHRTWCRIRIPYLRMCITWASEELQDLEAEFVFSRALDEHQRKHLGQQIESHKLWLDLHRIDLADCELAVRPLPVARQQGGQP